MRHHPVLLDVLYQRVDGQSPGAALSQPGGEAGETIAEDRTNAVANQSAGNHGDHLEDR